MKTVEVLFQNLQSHENTKFTLKPGMNFILADDNNVGKSTIFKVLSRVAKAPNVSPSKVLPLIRYGCFEALAAFKFENETVIARFTKYEREAAKIFFEHVHSDGEVTRSVTCPSALLDALGIVVGENGELVNFNDANSVQLIAEVSPEADTIITHVMLDPKVESIKRNIYVLSREVSADARDFDHKVKLLEQNLSDWTFRPAVSEFFERQELLEVVCTLVDELPQFSAGARRLPGADELSLYHDTVELISGIQGLAELDVTSRLEVDVKSVRDLIDVVQRLQRVPSAVQVLEKNVPSLDDVEKCRQLNSTVSKLLTAVRSAEQIQTYSRKLNTLEQERGQILAQLQQNTKQIDCPIKGRVYYTDEKCVPHNS